MWANEIPDMSDTPWSKPMTIAAVIPFYNGRKFILDALKSVLTQTLAPQDIIVVDDGSTDDGPAIVGQLAVGSPIRLLRKQHGGRSSARNYGVAHAETDLIALLDQNDIWYPEHLESLLRNRRSWSFCWMEWVLKAWKRPVASIRPLGNATT